MSYGTIDEEELRRQGQRMVEQQAGFTRRDVQDLAEHVKLHNEVLAVSGMLPGELARLRVIAEQEREHERLHNDVAEQLRQERHHDVFVAVLAAQVTRSSDMLLASVIDSMLEAADYAATKAYPPPKVAE